MLTHVDEGGTEYVTTATASAILGIKPKSVIEAVKRCGISGAVKASGVLFVPREAVEEYAARSHRGGGRDGAAGCPTAY